MAKGMSAIVRQLIRERKITASRTTTSMVVKELEGGESDLNEARESLKVGKHKWATVQAYYSAFHSARALLYAKGLREKSHRGLLSALRELYSRQIPQSLLDSFEETMNLREAADYGLVYSEEGANDAVNTAEEFLGKARNILLPIRKPTGPRMDIQPYLATQRPSPTSRRQSKASTESPHRTLTRKSRMLSRAFGVDKGRVKRFIEMDRGKNH